jgi:putative transposase
MLKAYNTEINPTEKQKQKIKQTIGTCRYIYNFYIAYNKEVCEKTKEFVSGYSFSKWLNNEYIPNNLEKTWIKETSSKATKQAIMNAETAFKRFFKGKSKYPSFKKKSRQDVKMYAPKNSKNDWFTERHRVKIPTIGWVRLKEYGYIPLGNDTVKSGTVSMKGDKYFVSILVEEPDIKKTPKEELTEGIGIDLGLKDFAIISSGKVFKNINKSSRVKKLEKKLKREQRKLSRKYESLKIRRKQGGETVSQKNIDKQIVKVQRLHMKLNNIRTDYQNKTIFEILKQKPSYIVLEDLNVSGMMKNRHLSKAIAKQKFHEFRVKLTYKAKQLGIEMRIVDRFYPSSKKCSNCEGIKSDLKLSDRIYECECGLKIDRDVNASINLKNAKEYEVAY